MKLTSKTQGCCKVDSVRPHAAIEQKGNQFTAVSTFATKGYGIPLPMRLPVMSTVRSLNNYSRFQGTMRKIEGKIVKSLMSQAVSNYVS